MADRIPVDVEAALLPLIPTFFENRRQDLQAIQAALDAGDVEPLVRLGHNMKGAGGGYGFDRISELGAALETAARAGDLASIRSVHADLADYLARVEVIPA